MKNKNKIIYQRKECIIFSILLLFSIIKSLSYKEAMSMQAKKFSKGKDIIK